MPQELFTFTFDDGVKIVAATSKEAIREWKKTIEATIRDTERRLQQLREYRDNPVLTSSTRYQE